MNSFRRKTISYISENEDFPTNLIHEMEQKIYDESKKYAIHKRISDSWYCPLFRMIYDHKARHIASNIVRNSHVSNANIVSRIKNNEISSLELVTMLPQYMYPERWHNEVHAKRLRDHYMRTAKSVAMTDQFTCARCKMKECSFTEIQMRSCDEPATLFIQCINCGHGWRMG